MHRVAQAFQDIELLPTAPALLPKLLDLLHDSNAGLDQVAKLVELEPSVAVQVLRMSNAACFASCDRTASIPEAISRLGFQVVYMMVVAVTGKSLLALAGPEGASDIRHLWKHSVLSGLAAEMIASDYQKEAASLFTAGLLHDFGKVVLAAAFKAEYTSLLAEARTASVNSAALEQKNYGCDHAEVGGRLLARWHFPEFMIGAVRDHHAPPGFTFKCPAAIVAAASRLAHLLEDELSADSKMEQQSWSRAGFDEERQLEYVERLRGKADLVEALADA